MISLEIDPLIAVAVMAATACTDAIYVLFTNAVVKRRACPPPAGAASGTCSPRSRSSPIPTIGAM